ncbi:MAG: hypothetical protein VX619_09680 [bacterium]|nr:hypothetical protein [bacterium]
MTWTSPVNQSYWPDSYNQILPWMQLLEPDYIRTYEWLLLASTRSNENIADQKLPKDYQKQIPMQLSIPASAYVEIPNILGAYLQDENTLEESIRKTYIKLTQNSKTPITPVQRGEIIAYQFISGRFKNCFDLFIGLDSDDFFTAWEQFELIIHLLGYSSKNDLNLAPYSNLLKKIEPETAMLLKAGFLSPTQYDLNSLTEKSWLNLLAERLWSAKQIYGQSFNHLDFSLLLNSMNNEIEGVEDLNAIIMLQLVTKASIDDSFNKLRELLDSRWEKGQDRHLVKLLRSLVLADRYDLSHEIFPKIVKTEFKIIALLLIQKDHQFIGCTQRFPDPKKTDYYLKTQKQLNHAIGKAQKLKTKVEFLEKGLKFGLKIVFILILVLILNYFEIL